MEEKVLSIIAEQLGIGEDEIQKESSFGRDLGADSLDFLELLMSCEEEFDIDIPEDDAEGIKTVQHLMDYLQKKSHPRMT
ncbi:MAG: acyl carrier protein [Deltaproteobacteria bacterium]|nr:acyl carrier protein [Deltaproteobacteria bacterium]